MPRERAPAEIDPVERIASRSATLPGPMRSPLARSIRMERRGPAMAFGSRENDVEESRASLQNRQVTYCSQCTRMRESENSSLSADRYIRWNIPGQGGIADARAERHRLRRLL